MNTTDKTLKPTLGSAYGYGWKIMKERFITLFLIVILLGIAGWPMAIFQIKVDSPKDIAVWMLLVQIFAVAYSLFILNPLKYGGKLVFLKSVRGEEFDVKEVFTGFRDYLNVVLAGLFAGAIVAIGIAFLIIPGIVFACRLVFVPYLVMDKKLDAIKAIEESWRLSKGYGWRIFAMGLLTIPLFIAGIIALVFGVFIVIIWVKAAFAALYQAALDEKGDIPAREVPEVLDSDLKE